MESAQNITNLSVEASFEKAFKDYYRELVAFTYQYVEDHDMAEELVQEMFSNVWAKSSQIDIRTSVKSYLYGAVRNAALNHLKHQKVTRKYQEHEQHKIDYFEVDFLELDELQAEIDLAINKLPEKCREIFEMSRFEGKKNKEIAEKLNLSIKTIENQMGRALKVMRTALNKYLPSFIIVIISVAQKNLWG